MAEFASFIGLTKGRSAPLLSALTARIGSALHRTAAEGYAERCGRVERTGTAGMI